MLYCSSYHDTIRSNPAIHEWFLIRDLLGHRTESTRVTGWQGWSTATQNQKGSLAARPMIRSDVQYSLIHLPSDNAPHLLTDAESNSRFGLKCLITVIIKADHNLGPIQGGILSLDWRSRRHGDDELSQRLIEESAKRGDSNKSLGP